MRQKTPAACKFVLLKRFLSRKSVSAGQCRGIVHDISFNEQGCNILTESGTLMTIKVCCTCALHMILTASILIVSLVTIVTIGGATLLAETPHDSSFISDLLLSYSAKYCSIYTVVMYDNR